MSKTRLRNPMAIVCCAALLTVSGAATVPGQVDFQGLLLDTGGQPVNGAVNLTFTLFDAATGGSSQWTESHVAVSVVDGVYDVTLGSQVPLTPSVLGGGSLFLEVVVDGETLAPRRPLLAVPYAVRAETAENVESVGGIDPTFIAQIFEHVDYDGNGIPNDDPIEGTVDVDQDGKANFIDPDNDGDEIDDSAEVTQGSDPNVVTPRITGFTPNELEANQPAALVTISGTNFDLPGLAVVFGSETPTPFNITPTSAQVTVGPQAAGDAAVTVSSSNGESFQSTFGFIPLIRAFVTVASFDGNLSGVAGADAKCSAAASAAGLSGSYFAWLADSSTDPLSRVTQLPEISFQHIDGSEFDDESFFTGSSTGPSRDEFGNTPLPGAPESWTGGGRALTGPYCGDWTSSSSASSGRVGRFGISAWESFADRDCDELRHLDCFEVE